MSPLRRGHLLGARSHTSTAYSTPRIHRELAFRLWGLAQRVIGAPNRLPEVMGLNARRELAPAVDTDRVHERDDKLVS